MGSRQRRAREVFFATLDAGAMTNSVTCDSLVQRTVFDDAARIALRLSLGDVLGPLHPGGCFPLVEDPRPSDRACILGMMVLRPADHAWMAEQIESDAPAAVREIGDWCYDVAGVGGSWPVSGGNALDAYRLALQYGTVDAVMAGTNTMTREGVARGTRSAHLWQPYTPLSWPALRAHREWLEPAIAALRCEWQRQGLLSARRYPAQVAVTRGLSRDDSGVDILDARIFTDRHPDGSPIEAWILTSEAGREILSARARAKHRGLEERILACSPPDLPGEIDVARVPMLLRKYLDARLVEHDGGAISLAAFVEAGAVAQLNLTLMRRRSVRQVIETSPRLDAASREELLASWNGRARLFPSGRGPLPKGWALVQAVVEEGRDAEAVVATFDVRAAR